MSTRIIENYKGFHIERGGPGYVAGHVDFADEQDPRACWGRTLDQCKEHIDFVIENHELTEEGHFPED